MKHSGFILMENQQNIFICSIHRLVEAEGVFILGNAGE